MDLLERMKLRTGSEDEAILSDCLESAKEAILSRRFPHCERPTREVPVVDENGDPVLDDEENPVVTEETFVEDKYLDLQFRMALDLFNKQGAEGEVSHSENGISRGYQSPWISSQLLSEVVPCVGVPQ